MDRPELQIRHAGTADLPSLLDLYQHLTPGDERATPEVAVDTLDRLLAYAGSAVFIGELDGVAVASCTLIVIPNLTRGGRAYGLVENVVTHIDYRARGFGKQLLAAATDAAWAADCYKIMLMTGSTTRETLNFYLGAGFEQSKTGFQKRLIPARTDP